MAQDTDIVIAVPDDIACKILQEGYRCTLRRRVPASRNREVALRAYRRFQCSRPPTLLKVTALPLGVDTVPHKDGIKLSTLHLPAQCLARIDRHHSTPNLPTGSSAFRPLERTSSLRPSSTFNQPPRVEVACSLQGRQNMRTLYHATRESNAEAICRQRSFHPGSRGFLGPGIYFSESPGSARRYCQCRTGSGQIVVLHCVVNLGSLRVVDRGTHTRQELLSEGFDSFKESGRDCYMLPDDSYRQIDMSSVYIDHRA